MVCFLSILKTAKKVVKASKCPERGLLMPFDFLPQVEHTAAIVDMGQWVMNEALRQIAEWQQRGIGWPVSRQHRGTPSGAPRFHGRTVKDLAALPQRQTGLADTGDSGNQCT